MRLALVPLLLLVACRPAAPAAAPGTAPDDEDAPLALARVRGPAGPVPTETFVGRLLAADMICVGEQHDDAGHHAIQHALFRRLVASEGRVLALGLEMVQRSWQGALDDYVRGDLGAERLAEVTEWDERWGFDFWMYEPMFHTAHEHGIRLLALNAPKELTRAVARMGLDHLPEQVRASLPELKLDDDGHRRFFWAAMGFGEPDAATPHDPPSDPHHGERHEQNPHDPHDGATERYYTAQVIWDETMAEGAAAWLESPDRQVMVVAGNGHCHRSAVPARVLRRRPQAEVLSVLLQTGDVPLPPHASSDYVVQLPAVPQDESEPPAMASLGSP